MQERLKIIKDKLERLIALDTAYKVFGSNEPWNGHHYVLNECLSDAELDDFERYMEVTLPHEYRSFLQLVADGEAGPYYGLYSLQVAVDEVRSRWTEEQTREAWQTTLAEFALDTPGVEKYLSEIKSLPHVSPVVHFEPDFPVAPIPSKGPIRGVLFLSEYGCGGYYMLVVHGPAYGQVWFYQSQEYVVPVCDSKGHVFTFWDWYEHWLDQSLQLLVTS